MRKKEAVIKANKRSFGKEILRNNLNIYDVFYVIPG